MSGRDFLTQVAETIPFDNSDNSFMSDNTQDAIEEAKQNAEGFPRAGIRATANGTVSNNQWIGPTELLPNTPLIVFPVDTKLNEITWSNQNTDISFSIQFRRGSKTGTIFYTLVVVNSTTGYGYVSGLDFTFTPGEVIYAQYIDQGTNASDFEVTLWISRINV